MKAGAGIGAISLLIGMVLLIGNKTGCWPTSMIHNHQLPQPVRRPYQLFIPVNPPNSEKDQHNGDGRQNHAQTIVFET